MLKIFCYSSKNELGVSTNQSSNSDPLNDILNLGCPIVHLLLTPNPWDAIQSKYNSVMLSFHYKAISVLIETQLIFGWALNFMHHFC